MLNPNTYTIVPAIVKIAGGVCIKCVPVLYSRKGIITVTTKGNASQSRRCNNREGDF
jgi:hypothetical protein